MFNGRKSCYTTFWRTRLSKTIGLSLLGVLIIQRCFTSYIPVFKYGQTDIAMIETVPGWPSGIGINQMLEKVRTLSPGVLIHDPQWGHPGTDLHVYAKRFPHLTLISGSQSVLKNIGDVYRRARNRGLDLHFVYDTRGDADKSWRQKVFSHEMLCWKKSSIIKEYKGKVFNNSLLVICTARRD